MVSYDNDIDPLQSSGDHKECHKWPPGDHVIFMIFISLMGLF
jgi:hypothetical protein